MIRKIRGVAHVYANDSQIRNFPIPRYPAVALVALVAVALGALVSSAQRQPGPGTYTFQSAQGTFQMTIPATNAAAGPVSGGHALLKAAKDGDLEKAKRLLKGSPDLVFFEDATGETALYRAVFSGHREIVELLLANHANVNARALSGATPLFPAARKGDKDIAELLLASGAEVDAVQDYWGTPLVSAAAQGHKDVVELLLAHKARFSTGLHKAAEFGHKDVVELLLAKGADVNAKDVHGYTPLYWAVIGLQSQKAAAAKAHLEIMELLLANGADVNARDKHGSTALASVLGVPQLYPNARAIVKLLRQHGGEE